MKKRILSLALTLAMALSLAVPALAVGEADLLLPESENDYLFTTTQAEEPNPYAAFVEQFYVQHTQEHPEEQAAFDPHAWWQENIGEYWDSETEYIDHMVEWGEWDSADQFGQMMWQYYLSDQATEAWRAQEVEAYRAAHPGELEALTLEQLLAWQGYTETLTPIMQFIQDSYYDFEDESQALPYLLWDYVSDRNYTLTNHEEFLTYQAQYPDRWAEFDADAFFEEEHGSWSRQSKAEYMDYRHLFTEEEFTEVMFVEYVDYNHWEWDWDDTDYDYDNDWDYDYGWNSGKPLRLVVNGQVMEDAVISAEDGWSYIAPATVNAILDSHYVDEGELMPLRATMESEGWDVGWNEYENAIFLVDTAAAKARISESLTALDEIVAWAMEHTDVESGKSYKTTETLDVTLTTLNSLDGDTDYKLQVTLDMLQKDNTLELTVKVNAADVLELLGDDILELAAGELPQLSLSDLPTLMKGLEFNAIADLDAGNFYWNVPVLAAFDDTVTADTWYGASLGMGLDEMLQTSLGMDSEALLSNLSGLMADYIYEEQLLSDSARWWSSPEVAWEEFDVMVSTLNAVMGPDRVKRSGGALTWKVDTKTINDLFAQISGEDLAPFKSYELSYVMRDNGTFTADMDLRPDFQAMMKNAFDSYYDPYFSYSLMGILSGRLLNLFDFQITAHSSGSMDKAAGTMEYHQKNAFKLKLDTEMTRTEVKDGPALTPPEGAPVEMVMDLGTALLFTPAL